LSASADGNRLALLKWTHQTQIYVGELTTGGTHLSPPRRLRYQDTDDRPTGWTPDSKAILFDSFSNGASVLYKQAIDQDAAQTLLNEPQRPVYPMWPRVTPDGAGIMYVEIPRGTSESMHLMRMPLNGGVPQRVLEITKPLNVGCARVPASRCVLFEETQDGKQLVLTAFDLLKGRGKVLRTLEKDPTVHQYGLKSNCSRFLVAPTAKSRCRAGRHCLGWAWHGPQTGGGSTAVLRRLGEAHCFMWISVGTLRCCGSPKEPRDTSGALPRPTVATLPYTET
jgi:hypothetical protein